MKVYGKITVVLSSCCLLDFDELVNELNIHYPIGYAGLFSTTPKTFLVLKTLPKRTCMALGKVAKICAEFVHDFEVLPGVDKEVFRYQALEERGGFRTHGGKRSKIKKSNKPQPTIYLYTNALGQEDVSHIASEGVEDLVGSEDDVVQFFDKNYTTSAKKIITLEEWKKFRSYSRRKVRRWEKQEKLQGLCEELGIKKASESDSESDTEFNERLSTRPVYDPDSDSEGNVERKRKLLRNSFIERAPEMRKEVFLKAFEVLLLENPHNSNVIASTKDGYFKYFDGRRWIKAYNKDFFDKVTMKRIVKAQEMLKRVKLPDFTGNQVSLMVKSLLISRHGAEVDMQLKDKVDADAVRDGILAAENQEVRIGLVESTNKKKVERVGKTVQRGVLRNTTWEKLTKS